jgi:hypothetical protein
MVWLVGEKDRRGTEGREKLHRNKQVLLIGIGKKCSRENKWTWGPLNFSSLLKCEEMRKCRIKIWHFLCCPPLSLHDIVCLSYYFLLHIFNIRIFLSFQKSTTLLSLLFLFFSLIPINTSNLLYFSPISLFSHSLSPISLFSFSSHNQTHP